MKMKIEEALYNLRKAYDTIVKDYENIILTMDAELKAKDEEIDKLKEDEG